MKKSIQTGSASRFWLPRCLFLGTTATNSVIWLKQIVESDLGQDFRAVEIPHFERNV